MDERRRWFGFWVVLLSVLSSAPVALANIETNRKITAIYAQAQIEQKRLDKATSILKQHLAEDNKSPELWQLLGTTQLQAKQPALASEAFGQAIQYASADQVGRRRPT